MDSRPTLPHNWLESPHLENPYPLYEQARRETPIFYSPIFNLWGITRYRDVRAALMDPQRFSSAYFIRTPTAAPPEVTAALNEGYPEIQILVNEDPPSHTRTRSLVSQVFAPRRVLALEPHIRALTNQLIDRFVDAGQADLIGQLAYPLPMAVIGEFLGLPEEDLDQIKRWTQDLIMLTSPGVAPEQQLRSAHGSVAFQRYLEAQIENRRQTPRDDLLTSLLQARHEDETTLSVAQLISLLITMIFAGHETTTNLIGNTLLQTLQHPEIWRELQTRPGRAADVVEESLRIDAPVRGMFRATTEAVELGGTVIPAGASVLLLFGSANHDADVFPEPERFDPDRPNKEQNLSFGRGIHFCIGATLARLETQVVLTTLAQRLPNLRLDPDHPPTYLPSLLHRGPQHLRLAWD